MRIHHFGHLEQKRQSRKDSLYLELGKEKITEQPSYWKAHYELGVQYGQMGRMKEASDCFLEALKCDSSHRDIWLALGCALNEVGEYHLAEKSLRRAVAFDATYPEPYLNLAVSFMRQRKFPDAIAMLRKTLSLNPQMAVAYSNLAESYLVTNNIGRARDTYNQGLTHFPRCAKFIEGLGHCAYHEQLYAEALKYYEEALSIDTEARPVHYSMAKLYRVLNDNTRALAYLAEYKQHIVSQVTRYGRKHVNQVCDEYAYLEKMVATSSSLADVSIESDLGEFYFV